MVPKVGTDLKAAIRKMATPDNLAAYGKAVLRDLRVPEFSKRGMRGSKEFLIPPPGEHFWTGHSERNFLSSHAALIGIPKNEIDRLGRWRTKETTTGSEDYRRINKIVVRKIQRKVMTYWFEALQGADQEEFNEEVLRKYI